MEIKSIQAMYITYLSSFYQQNAKNAQKSKRPSPDGRKYANKWKVTKFGIATLFLLLILNFTFNSSSYCQLTRLSFCVTDSSASTNCITWKNDGFLHSILLKWQMENVFHFATFFS